MIFNTSELLQLHLSRTTAIFVVDCCQFGPSWIFGLKMELMACAGLVGRNFRKYFISLILSYKVRKNTSLLHCTANQVGTGQKLHFQPKNPAWAKLAAIINKNGCGTAEVWWRQFRKYFISLILSYKARKKTDLLRCTANQAGTALSVKNIQLGLNWLQSKTKMAVAQLMCDADSSKVFHIVDTNM